MTAAPAGQVSVGPYTSVAQAARLMRDHDLGAVLVTDDG
ncbi:CBS domain-containing protein, partial [Streptomyces cellulosae]